MAGAALDANRVNVRTPTTQPPFSWAVGPWVFSGEGWPKHSSQITQSHPEHRGAPRYIRGYISHPEGCKFIFTKTSKKPSFIWWWFSLSPWPLLLSWVSSFCEFNLLFIFHLPSSSFSWHSFLLAGGHHKPLRGGKMSWGNNQRPQGCFRWCLLGLTPTSSGASGFPFKLANATPRAFQLSSLQLAEPEFVDSWRKKCAEEARPPCCHPVGTHPNSFSQL